MLRSWVVVCPGCLKYLFAILCRDFSASRWASFGPLVTFVGVDVGASALHSKVKVMWVTGVPVLVES